MAVSKKIVDLTRLALQDRVLTYTERQTIVKLRNCPSCGGQIPLISDQCLYCGTFLNQQPENVYSMDVVGEEAELRVQAIPLAIWRHYP